MTLSTEAKCDVCLGHVMPDHGYLLVTENIVSSPKFWNRYYELHAKELEAHGVWSYDAFCRAQPVFLTCERLAAEPTPWLVCDQCISTFNVDSHLAMRYAQQWWESAGTFRPPGAGPADVSTVNMGDGRAWKNLSTLTTVTSVQPRKRWWQVWK